MIDEAEAPMDEDALPLARTTSTGSRWLHALRVVHPFPTLLNVVATAGLVFVATDGSPDGSVLARMMLAMLFAQSAIGVTNDLFDQDLDAATKPWKPLPSGALHPSAAIAIDAGLIAAALGIGVTLGTASLLLLALGLSCGLAYDVRLKRSAWSATPFMVAIPVLPAWVWVTTGEWREVLWWILPLGALIGLSLHLANSLPDLEDDAAHGVRGLAHMLGRSSASMLAWSAFAVALAVTALLAVVVSYDLAVYVAAASFAGGCLIASAVVPSVRPGPQAYQFGWGAIAVGALVVAVGWLAAVT